MNSEKIINDFSIHFEVVRGFESKERYAFDFSIEKKSKRNRIKDSWVSVEIGNTLNKQV